MDIKYKNQKYSVESKEENNEFVLNIDGEKSKWNARIINDNISSVLINGKLVNTYRAESENQIHVVIDGLNYTFDKINEEEKSYVKDNKASANEDLIKPPMPGSIVKVLVETGDKVTEGQSLIIVEAMKMETILYSSIDGIEKEINVSAGQQVDSDKTLLVIEKEVTENKG